MTDLGLLDRCFEQRESLGDPPGVGQGFRQLTQAGREPKADVGVGDLVKVGLQQPRSCVDIATLEDDNSLKPRTKRAPESQAMLSRIVEQHSCIVRCGG